MQTQIMKNMVILRNLPSNIADEAFIILKNNKKVKALTKTEIKSLQPPVIDNSEDYIVKEAEMVISNFLSKLENESKLKNYSMKLLEMKCKKLKLLSILFLITTVLFVFI